MNNVFERISRTANLFHDAQDIPEPEWHCDIPMNSLGRQCFTETNVNDEMYVSVGDKRWIKGQSYMKLECKWGNNTCKTSFGKYGKQPGNHVRSCARAATFTFTIHCSPNLT